jgi:hypothetical protein
VTAADVATDILMVAVAGSVPGLVLCAAMTVGINCAAPSLTVFGGCVCKSVSDVPVAITENAQIQSNALVRDEDFPVLFMMSISFAMRLKVRLASDAISPLPLPENLNGDSSGTLRSLFSFISPVNEVIPTGSGSVSARV